jgi:glycosyltransferase involved in cell wall biosynthesis
VSGRRIARLPLELLGLVLAATALIGRSRGDTLVWGPKPILNNRYWSDAMRNAGRKSLTLMESWYAINTREDYDLYFDDLVPRWLVGARLRRVLAPYFAFRFIVENASVLHMPFSGGPLGTTPWWQLEARLLRRAGVRTVVIPYGADVHMVSRFADPVRREAFAGSDVAEHERKIERRVRFWCRWADVIVVGFTLDGVPRWDAAVGNMVCIDLELWAPRVDYASADGRSGSVRILHAPNHRRLKGTEFLLEAVDVLREEGLAIELMLLERVPNDRVREAMRSADILADQFVDLGYGLAAIEGMASGLSVMCNLNDERATRLFDETSFLAECPVVSSTTRTIADDLRLLVTRPELRVELGRAGRAYVEKYHSYDSAQYLFGAIHDKLLRGLNIDLATLFHPDQASFNRSRRAIRHPLVDHRLIA